MRERDPDQQAQFLSDSPRDSDTLHATIQDHIKDCEQCSFAVENTKPRAFGQQSRMCAEYFKLVSMLTGAPLPDAMGGLTDG